MSTSRTSYRAKIAHLKKSDPVLKRLIKENPIKEFSVASPLPRARKRTPFEALVEAITSQQLSVKAADTIFARVAALTPGARFPTPAEVRAMRPTALRKCGLSQAKVSFVKDLARKVLDGTVDFKAMPRWSDEEVIAHLVQVKGIGRWTAEMFLIFSLGREDVFSYDDLGLRNAMKVAYRMRQQPTRARAEAIAAKWKPYRSLASRYLWASLRNLKGTPQK